MSPFERRFALTFSSRNAFLLLSLSTLAVTASAHKNPASSVRADKATTQQPSEGKALVDRIDRTVHFTDDQRRQAQVYLDQYEVALQAANQDGSLSTAEKTRRRAELKTQLKSQVEALLTPGQAERLQKSTEPFHLLPIRPAIGATFGLYFPSDAAARSIFGNSVASFGVSVSDNTKVGASTRLGFSLSDVSLSHDGNKLFVLSPQVSLVHWLRLTSDVVVYGKVGAGPAYFDYSYDTPAGVHFGAKRFGAQFSPEVGVRLYDRLQLALTYHLLTEPSGISLNGFGLEAKLVLFKF